RACAAAPVAISVSRSSIAVARSFLMLSPQKSALDGARRHPAKSKAQGRPTREESADEAERDGRALPHRDRRRGKGLFAEAVEDVDELREALRGLGLSAHDAVRYALLDVIAKHRQADAVQGGFSGRELLQQLHADPRLLHHPPDAAHLSLNP